MSTRRPPTPNIDLMELNSMNRDMPEQVVQIVESKVNSVEEMRRRDSYQKNATVSVNTLNTDNPSIRNGTQIEGHRRGL